MFENTIMLAGLGGAAAPLVIHLLARARYRTVDWGAMMFLREARTPWREGMRLREGLLLTTRMAAVSLLAIALARPVIGSSSASVAPAAIESHIAAAIVIDCSGSMAYEDVSGSRMDRARSTVLQILSTLKRGDRACLIMSGTPPAIAPQMSGDLQAIAAHVGDLKASPSSADLAAALGQASSVLEKQERAVRQLFVVCDRQSGSWRNVTDDYLAGWAAARHARSLARFVVVPVGGAETDNVSIESMAILNPPAVSGCSAEVKITVRNHGSTARTGLPLNLRVGGREVFASTVRVGGGETESVIATVMFPASAEAVLSAELTGGGPNLDDRRDLVVAISPPLHVLIVRGERSGPAGGAETSGPTAGAQTARAATTNAAATRAAVTGAAIERAARVDSGPTSTAAGSGASIGGSGAGAAVGDANAAAGGAVAGDDAELLRAALAPYAASGIVGADLGNVEIRSESQWDDSKLDDYRVIILADVSAPSEKQAAALEQLVYRGGGLLIAPGAGVRTEQYNRLMYREEGGLLPALLQSPAVGAVGIEPSTIDASHPMLRFLSGRVAVLAAQVTTYLPTTARTASAHVLASLTSGDACLIDAPYGRGRVLLATCSLGTNWSTLPLTNCYLPLVQSAARYLAGSNVPDRNSVTNEELVAVLEAPPAAGPALRGDVLRPDGTRETCDVTTIDERTEARYARSDVPGIYVMRIGPAGAGQRMELRFSVTAPSDESDLTPLADGDWKRLERGLGFTRMELGETPLAARLAGPRGSGEYWMVALLGVMGLMIAELALARKWSASDRRSMNA